LTHTNRIKTVVSGERLTHTPISSVFLEFSPLPDDRPATMPAPSTLHCSVPVGVDGALADGGGPILSALPDVKFLRAAAV